MSTAKRFTATVTERTGKAYEYTLWAPDLKSATALAKNDAPAGFIAVTVEPHPDQPEAVRLEIAEAESLSMPPTRTYHGWAEKQS